MEADFGGDGGDDGADVVAHCSGGGDGGRSQVYRSTVTLVT